MLARIVEYSPSSDAAAEFVQLIQKKVLPIVKGQEGCICAFVDLSHNAGPVILGVSVWKTKADAERYRREGYPDIEEMLRPFLKCGPKLRTFEVREIGNTVARVLRQATPLDLHVGRFVLAPSRRCRYLREGPNIQ